MLNNICSATLHSKKLECCLFAKVHSFLLYICLLSSEGLLFTFMRILRASISRAACYKSFVTIRTALIISAIGLKLQGNKQILYT